MGMHSSPDLSLPPLCPPQEGLGPRLGMVRKIHVAQNVVMSHTQYTFLYVYTPVVRRHFGFFCRSESPSQVYLFLVNFLLKRLENVPQTDWNQIFIAYDNMCNLDRMQAATEELPLPEPYNKLWHSVSKIIDVFHLRNHKRKECHVKYNPQALKEIHPHYNTEACEQTFSWLARYHKILSSLPKVHNHFFLHRLIKRRNRYNSYCYSNGKKPLLPNVKHFSNY